VVIDGLANIGLLSLGALGFYLLSKHFADLGDTRIRNAGIGLCFGLLAAVIINTPVTLAVGATFDTRAAPAALAGFFAGPLAGVICAMIAGTARFYVGGPMAVGAALSPFIYAALGIAAGYWVFKVKRRDATIRDFLALALLSVIVVLPCFFIDQGWAFGLKVLGSAWYMLLAGNVFGILILGLLTEEVRRAWAAHVETKRALVTSDMARGSAEMAVWRYDFENQRLVWDKAMHHLYGAPETREIKTFADWEEFVLPEDRGAVLQHFETCKETGRRFDAEFRICRPSDGSVRWIQAYGEFVKNAAGAAGEVIGLNWDVTSRKKLEETLRQKEGEARARSIELETTLSSLHHGVCVYSADGQLKLWNERLAETYDIAAGAISPELTYQYFRSLQGGDRSDLLQAGRLETEVEADGRARNVYHLDSGKIVSVVTSPMPDGGWLETHADITEQALADERIRQAALTDPLTGLANRVAFTARVEEFIERAARGVTGQALMLVDLNDFKAVNDTYGHPVGDRLLKAVAAELMAAAGENGLAVRLGGDEFALVIWDTTRQDVFDKATLLADRLSQPLKLDDVTAQVSVSIGISCILKSNRTPESVLAQADSALYKAKQARESGVMMFDKDIEAEVLNQRRIKTRLATDLRAVGLETWYQPFISLNDYRFVGGEALLRWRQPDGSFISPAEFIPLAEEAGLIEDIGRLVLEQAVAEAATWPEETKIAVNVSPRQLGTGHLVPDVLAALDKSGFSPHRLELEITENILIDGRRSAFADIEQLSAEGIAIAVDDFGTGYSSLSYLHRLPFSKLKIDRSFVADITSSRNCAMIVSAMVNMANTIGLEITAEGIETEEQAVKLKNLGCERGQGFLISRPIDSCALHEWRETYAPYEILPSLRPNLKYAGAG